MANFHASSAHSQSSSSSNSRNWISNVTSSLRHNAGYKVAGLFISAGALAGFSAYVDANDAQMSQGNQPASQEQRQEEKSAPQAETKIESNTETSSQAAGMTTNVSSNIDATGQSSTEVTVNGQKVEIPSNGSTNKVIQTPDGQINVQVNNSTSGNSYTSSNAYTSSSSFSSTSHNNQTNSSFSSNVTTSW